MNMLLHLKLEKELKRLSGQVNTTVFMKIGFRDARVSIL